MFFNILLMMETMETIKITPKEVSIEPAKKVKPEIVPEQ
jgi:hypothetical protein